MRFADFKCNKCGNISEYVLNNSDEKVSCAKCGSTDTVRVFAPVGIMSSSSSDFSSNSCSSSSKSCSGGSCSTCSGCS